MYTNATSIFFILNKTARFIKIEDYSCYRAIVPLLLVIVVLVLIRRPSATKNMYLDNPIELMTLKDIYTNKHTSLQIKLTGSSLH